MKKIFQLFIISCLLYACNNTSVENQVTQTQMPVQEKELKDAIDKYPDSILLKETLIKYYQENEDYDKALAETDIALKKDSNNVDLWDNKATLYVYQADTANAIKCYEKAIDIFPDPGYIMSVGVLYAYTKNKAAVDMADALIVGKNANAEKEALIIKSIYFRTIGEKEKAMTFLDDCLKLNYTYTPAYREKGIILYETGKYEEAIAVLNKGTTLQNNFSEGYYWLGRCYEKLKNTNEAIEQYRKALVYDPDYVEAKDALGKLGVK